MEEKRHFRWLGNLILLLMGIAFLYFGVYEVAIGRAKLDTATAYTTMLIILIIGEVVSAKTKAFVPSMFISGALFVLGYWTYFPKNILQLGGVASNLPTFLVMIMVVHLGTMLNAETLIKQWKSVIITLAGMVGILVIILTVGSVIMDARTAAVAAPPLTGGFVAAMMMQSVAPTEELAILSMAVYVLQGFVGYPLTSICLKRECKRVLQEKSNITTSENNLSQDNNLEFKSVKSMFPQIPERYRSDFTHIFTITFLTVISLYLDVLTNGYISKFVWALILGVCATMTGLIEKDILVKARSMGFIYTTIMMFSFSALKTVTPAILVLLLKQFIVLVSLATVGVAVISIPVGRKLGMSTPMSFALGLGTLAGGFPASYTLSVEAAKVMSTNREEYLLLENHLLPKTLVAGFVSATSGSVLVAGMVMALFFR